MKQLSRENHEFAIYANNIQSLGLLKESDKFEISDKELYHRIVKVLRLNSDTTIILFDSKIHLRCSIETINKEKIFFKVEQIFANKKITPEIYWLLPLLKKEAFEDCLYAFTEMGIQEVQPIITRKSQQIASHLGSDRIKNIIITAAEQSKQFILPQIHKPKSLDEVLQTLNLKTEEIKIFFDPAGIQFFDLIKNLKENNKSKIICAIGPEGDLTENEKQLLKDCNFQFCKLTETVLRAKQAVAVASGIFRTFL